MALNLNSFLYTELFMEIRACCNNQINPHFENVRELGRQFKILYPYNTTENNNWSVRNLKKKNNWIYMVTGTPMSIIKIFLP